MEMEISETRTKDEFTSEECNNNLVFREIGFAWDSQKHQLMRIWATAYVCQEQKSEMSVLRNLEYHKVYIYLGSCPKIPSAMRHVHENEY